MNNPQPESEPFGTDASAEWVDDLLHGLNTGCRDKRESLMLMADRSMAEFVRCGDLEWLDWRAIALEKMQKLLAAGER